MHHPENGTVRVVMRRDKTLKLCANHFITEDMQLNSHIGSDRAFNWITPGDFTDETTKQEFLAIKFGNTESKCIPIYIYNLKFKNLNFLFILDSGIWKDKFNEAIDIVKSKLNSSKSLNESSSDFNRTESSDSQSDEKLLDTTDEKSEKESADEGVVLQLSELKLEKDAANECTEPKLSEEILEKETNVPEN